MFQESVEQLITKTSMYIWYKNQRADYENNYNNNIANIASILNPYNSCKDKWMQLAGVEIYIILEQSSWARS